MQKCCIIEACTDLGTHVDGAHLGPEAIVSNMNLDKIKKVYKKDVVKSKDPNDLNKNITAINEFNEELYGVEKKTIEEKLFPITLGGDHSLAIASALASISEYQNLGIIWIDSHADFNTPETTITGNIHGYPFAAVCGFGNKDIVKFHKGNFYKFENAVLVGARDIDIPYEEENLKEAGVKVFTTEDIKSLGAKVVMEKAFEIAGNNTLGVHVSYDIDSIDPKEAPGVSVPAEKGFGIREANEILDVIIRNKDIVKSLDIVEFNPLYDKNDVTLNLARHLLNDFKNCKEKGLD